MKLFTVMCESDGGNYEPSGTPMMSCVVGVFSSMELAKQAFPNEMDKTDAEGSYLGVNTNHYHIQEMELDHYKPMPSCEFCHHPINEHHADCKRFDEHPSECDADEQENNMRAIALEEADMLEHQQDDYQSEPDIEATEFNNACGDR